MQAHRVRDQLLLHLSINAQLFEGAQHTSHIYYNA